MENRIIKSILSLIVAVPFMAFAHTTITSPYGTDEIVLIPKLIEEHWSTNSSSFQEFELCSKQKASARNQEDNQYAHAVLVESGTLASVLGERIFEIITVR